MSDGLAYFKKVYDDVPEWVQKMHDYSPEALDYYTGLRSGIMQEGHLSTKEKDLLLVGINAARLYGRSMVYHTKGALDRGATIPELVEYLLVSYLYNGAHALKTGLKSLEFALAIKQSSEVSAETSEGILNRMIDLLGNEHTDFIHEVLDSVRSTNKKLTAQKLLSEGVVSSKLKHILLAGIHMTELQGDAAGRWMEEAREHGATEAELAETGLICLLTGGIPAWFKASDSLKNKVGSRVEEL